MNPRISILDRRFRYVKAADMGPHHLRELFARKAPWETA